MSDKQALADLIEKMGSSPEGQKALREMGVKFGTGAASRIDWALSKGKVAWVSVLATKGRRSGKGIKPSTYQFDGAAQEIRFCDVDDLTGANIKMGKTGSRVSQTGRITTNNITAAFLIAFGVEVPEPMLREAREHGLAVKVLTGKARTFADQTRVTGHQPV